MTGYGPRVDSLPGCLLMVFATVGGYGALGSLAILILRQPRWNLSALDIAYWTLAALVALAQHSWRRQQPASQRPPAMPPLVRHCLVAGLLWILAQSVHLAA